MTDVSPPDEPPNGRPEAQLPPPPVAPPVRPPPPAGARHGYGSGPVDSRGRPLAEWWQRAVAIVIDVILLAVTYRILSAIFGTGTGIVTGLTGTSVVVNTGHLITSELIELVLTLAYFGILDGSSSGQTVGKLVV
ncbi:MAG: RDD family protein, partial [Acidimicrobiales bacterium]